MPFSKIAELGAEIGKAQLIMESKDNHIEHLTEENEKLRERVQQMAGELNTLRSSPGAKAAN